jgi:hypothetical protein
MLLCIQEPLNLCFVHVCMLVLLFFFFCPLCIQADVDSQVIGYKDVSKSAIDIWKEVLRSCKSACLRSQVYFYVIIFLKMHFSGIP